VDCRRLYGERFLLVGVQRRAARGQCSAEELGLPVRASWRVGWQGESLRSSDRGVVVVPWRRGIVAMVATCDRPDGGTSTVAVRRVSGAVRCGTVRYGVVQLIQRERGTFLRKDQLWQ